MTTTPQPGPAGPPPRKWWPPRRLRVRLAGRSGEAGPPPRKWWPLRPLTVVVIAVLVILAVVAAVVVPPLFDRCGGGLFDSDGSCIGVSDARDFGDPELTTLMASISVANDEVEAGDYYTIGYLVPFEPPGRQTSLSAELRHELAGVHLAQVQNNMRDSVKIKVLVGNAGPEGVRAVEVARQLRAEAGGPDRLRAVVGLGNSIQTTRGAIEALTRRQPGGSDEPGPVATIGSRLTADDLTLDRSGRRIEGFARVAPTNTGEAAVAVQLIREKGAQRPTLISDRSDTDDYVSSLATAFTAAFGGQASSESFNADLGSLWIPFDTIKSNLCIEPRPDAVYFAGRGDALAELTRALGGRTCTDYRFDIVTGDDIAGLRDAAVAGDPGIPPTLRGIEVRYTGLANPALWAPNLGLTFDKSAAEYLGASGIDLTDGVAIMGHDAMMLAVTAIQRAARPGGVPATTDAVIQALYSVRGAALLNGASGVISLDECGVPENKLFPVLKMNPDGTSTLVRPANGTASRCSGRS
ncbi:MAG: ABC transporter substrate-binding protein [Pseudonocardia sp.]